MSEELKHKIYSATECISEQKMFDYIDNKLNAHEQHKVEKHLLDCELCSDAIEGLELLKNRNRITSINNKIIERLSITPKKDSKIISFNFKTITSIAAAIALLVGGVFLFKQFAPQKMQENEVAELKKESAPPPSVTINTTESATVSDTIISKQTESITRSKNNVQFETSDKLQQQIALAEEQKPSTYYKNSISSGEGSTANDIVTTEDATTKSDKNYDMIIPAESTIPKAGLLEKDLRLDETKKAEEKNEITTASSLAQNNAPSQKKGYDNFDVDKKTSKNNRFQSDTKGKENAAKQVTNGDIAGNVEYAPQSIVYDQENLKTEKTRVETNQKSLADSVFIFGSGKPQFPGGSDSLKAFIKKNFDVSKNTFNWNSTMGTKIVVEFTIDTKGNILDPIIKQGINQELNDKAIEMVKKMPKWIPVSKPYKYELPINLDLK